MPVRYEHLKDLSEEIKQALQEERNNMARAALIKFFEMAYEQSWKILKKVLMQDFSLESLGSKDTFREAARVGLIENPEPWFEFVRDRNETVHSYNKDVADEIINDLSSFVVELDKLIANLGKHYDKS